MRAATILRRARHASASIRVRLTLWHLLILGLVFLVFNVILVSDVRLKVDAAQRAQLVELAQQMADAYSPSDGLIHMQALPSVKFSAKVVPKTLGQGPYLPAQSVALFVDSQGAVTQAIGALSPSEVGELQRFLVAASNSAGASDFTHAGGAYGSLSLTADQPPTAPKAESYVAYTTDVVSQGRLVGTLVVAMPSSLNQTEQLVLPSLLVAAPMTLLVAALGGYWLATRALRPVRLITRAAQEISETDLSRRLRLTTHDELGELAATFDHMLDRLEAAFERQRQFTADASHELRTPLTIINLEVSRALAAPRTPAEYERTLGVIQAENLAMGRLVSDLLTLARADAGHERLRLEPLDLSDVALEAVERLSPLARERGVRLALGGLPPLPVRGDRQTLAQALANLVENAVKHTAGVSSRVTVSTHLDREGGRDWAVASVADDGPGIAPEHLPHLFDRFYRADAARATTDGAGDPPMNAPATTSSGLGLAIARWAAQAHGGDVRAHSEPGAGATFEVWLPLAGAAPTLKPLVEKSTHGAG